MKSEKNNIRQIANESNREHNFKICCEIYISILSYLQKKLVALYTCRHISYPMIQPRDDGFWHRNSDCMDKISLVASLVDGTGNYHLRLISALCVPFFHTLEYVIKRRYIFLVVKNLIPMDSLCRRNDVCLPVLSPL